jgi:hypothetical protein
MHALYNTQQTGRTGVASTTGSQFDTQVKAPRIIVVLRNVDGWRSSMTGSAGGEDMESPRGKAAGMDEENGNTQLTLLWLSVRLRGYFAPGQVSSGRVISGWMRLLMPDEDEVRSSQDSQHRVHDRRGRSMCT